MKDFGPGFPEWTELGQDGGLDPLGMQRPIEAIYQSLLPGSHYFEQREQRVRERREE